MKSTIITQDGLTWYLSFSSNTLHAYPWIWPPLWIQMWGELAFHAFSLNTNARFSTYFVFWWHTPTGKRNIGHVSLDKYSTVQPSPVNLRWWRFYTQSHDLPAPPLRQRGVRYMLWEWNSTWFILPCWRNMPRLQIQIQIQFIWSTIEPYFGKLEVSIRVAKPHQVIL